MLGKVKTREQLELPELREGVVIGLLTLGALHAVGLIAYRICMHLSGVFYLVFNANVREAN